jgi:hypothetical protein
MQRTVTLSEGVRVKLGAYVKAIKRAKKNPERTFERGLSGWWPVTGREIVQEFHRGLQERITSGLPRSEPWRRPALREDRKGATTRLLAHVRKHGRECRACDARFIPQGLWQRFCSPGCQRDFY